MAYRRRVSRKKFIGDPHTQPSLPSSNWSRGQVVCVTSIDPSIAKRDFVSRDFLMNYDDDELD